MSKNISKIIKDTLKLISLGIFISMNGLPVNSFAMDDGEADRTRPSSPSLILDDGEALRNLFKESTTLVDLPGEVIGHIFSFLDSNSLNNASLVSHWLYKIRCDMKSNVYLDSKKRFSLGEDLSSWTESRPIDKITSVREASYVLGTFLRILPDISNLRVLCLRHDNIDSYIEMLPKFLQRTPCLDILDLRGSCRRISIETEERLAVALGFVPHLRTLCLQENPLMFDGARVPLQVFKSLPNLEVLNLKSCLIEDQGIVALASVLKHLPRLRILDLRGNALGATNTSEYTSVGITALAGALKNIKNLEVLDLRQNFIRYEGGKIIAGALQNIPNLRALYLDLGLNMGHEERLPGSADISLLASSLKKVPHLRVLDLVNSGLEIKDIRVLAPELKHLKHLHTLDLSDNELEDQGVEVLLKSLISGHVPNLCTLNLAGNSITYAGIEFLISVLHKLPNLRTLNLSYNRLGLERVAMLKAQILVSFPNLLLDLSEQIM